jgi:hypothetical protein
MNVVSMNVSSLINRNCCQAAERNEKTNSIKTIGQFSDLKLNYSFAN